MHIISTINPKTQSADDVPVVLITLEGKSKFLPRPETYKEMQRLVRNHYDIDANVGLQFEVSSWDVCDGKSVEVTEAAYPLLAPLLDSVSTVVVQAGRDRVTHPTPSATPPLRADEEIEDEQTVSEYLEPEPSPRRAPASVPRWEPKVESDAEEDVPRGFHMRFEDENGSISVHSDAEDDAPHARQVLTKEYPTERQQAKAKAAPKAHSDEDEQEYDASHARQVFSTERQQAKAKAAPKARKPPVAPAHDETEEVVVKKEFHVERNSKQAKAKAASKPAPPTAGPSKSRSPADLFDDTSESSHATSASDPDARFKISITGPQQTKVEFNTRGRHFVRKVLQGACKTFDVDFNRAKLMLRVPIDGHDDMALLELGNEETMWKAGVRPDAKLIIRIDRDEDESEDED